MPPTTILPPPPNPAAAARGTTTTPSNHPRPTKKRLLSFRQLYCLTTIILLASGHLVGLGHIAFLIFSIIYILFLSKFSFPPLPPPAVASPEKPIFSPNNKILRYYVTVGAIIGLFMPIGYIVVGIYNGDKEEIKVAAPHLFLLASQVFMEGVVFTGEFGIPVRVFVPVFYNSYRVVEIIEWLRAEILKSGGGDRGGSSRGDRRVVVGRALAVANMVFWCFNLFGFLIPVYIPRAFKRYYGAASKSD